MSLFRMGGGELMARRYTSVISLIDLLKIVADDWRLHIPYHLWTLNIEQPVMIIFTLFIGSS